MALNVGSLKGPARTKGWILARGWIRGFMLILLASLLLVGKGYAEEEYLDPEDAFRLSAAVNATEFVDLHFQIAPEYYMYRERFSIETDGGDAVGELQTPAGIVTYDPTFDRDMEVYRQGVTLRLPLHSEALSGAPIRVAITSQGCADAGLCYTPITQELELIAGEKGYQVQGEYASDKVPTPEEWAVLLQSAPQIAQQNTASAFAMNDVGLAQYLQNVAWLELVLLSFALGALLSFTPCVLPMVPILLAIIAGQQKQQVQKRSHGLFMALAFVLGLSVVYTLLGMAAGLLGAGLAAWLQTPWVLGVFAVLLALFGLAMLDVFTLQLSSVWQGKLNERLNRLPGGRFGGVFAMGMLSALIVGPCVAAPLAGVLLFISQTGDVLLGGSALFALAWGSGVLLIILGAGSGAFMPKAGAWMNHVKTAFALMLFATAWWMVAPVLPDWLATAGWAVLLIWVAVLLGLLTRPAVLAPLMALRQALAMLLALWAAFIVLGIALGVPSALQPLQGLKSVVGATTTTMAPTVQFERIQTVEELDARVASARKPVLLDFYADWCVSCIEMEKFTFTDAGVAQRMQQFELLQVDVTKNTPADRELLKRFSLFGPPGILFFDTQGRYLEQARVIGFQKAEQFSRVLDQVLQGQ